MLPPASKTPLAQVRDLGYVVWFFVCSFLVLSPSKVEAGILRQTFIVEGPALCVVGMAAAVVSGPLKVILSSGSSFA